MRTTQLGSYIERETPELITRAPSELTPISKAARQAIFAGRQLSVMKQHAQNAVAQAQANAQAQQMQEVIDGEAT